MTEKKNREAPISYRLPESLRGEFRSRVEKSDLSVNAFLTASVFGQEPPRQSRRPAIEQRDVARLLAETALLNDRLKYLGEAGADAALLYEAVRDLHEIRAACLIALGRTP